MTRSDTLHIDDKGKLRYFSQLNPLIDESGRVLLGRRYPTNQVAEKRIEGVAQRIAGGTWRYEYCGRPFELERNAHARYCQRDRQCYTRAYFVRWKAWHETVYQEAVRSLDRVRALHPDGSAETRAAEEHLEWARKRRGSRRKNPESSKWT
ncbi:hypothetical protein CSC82_11565 [Rhodobacteraceae bacterium 4F10]|nr:hypothetical protein CSC82_11565 [Rhodobacteraceae bacterium 4F10]